MASCASPIRSNPSATTVKANKYLHEGVSVDDASSFRHQSGTAQDGSGSRSITSRRISVSMNAQQTANLAPAKQPVLAASSNAFSSSLLNPVNVVASLSSGPSAASYSVPPRPKPGRKPAIDRPSEKRKAQNREAQRAFRERKVAHTEELRKDIDQLKQAYTDVVAENGSLKRKLQEMQESQKQVEKQSERRDQLVSQLQDEVRKYRQQEEHWARLEHEHANAKRRLRQREEALKAMDLRDNSDHRPNSPEVTRLHKEMTLTGMQHRSPITPPQHSPLQDPDSSCGNCAQTGYCKCVEDFTIDLSSAPPLTSVLHSTAVTAPVYEDLEMDFTSQPISRPRVIPDELPLSSATDSKPGCGFCKDSTDCPCNPQPAHSTDVTSAMTRPEDPMQISSIVEPGSCLKCQTNPEQRRFCIEVSKSRQLSQEFPDRSSKRARLDDGRPSTMTCNEMYQASKHVVAESRRNGRTKPAEMESMFNSYARTNLNALSRSEAKPGMRYRTYSTLEIDGIETLAALSRAPTTGS